jgi:glucosamine-6-phosphate deaminase
MHKFVTTTATVVKGCRACDTATVMHVPATSTAEDPGRYDKRISAAGGVGVQLLGIGGNGHIGFNEPGSPLGSGTR